MSSDEERDKGGRIVTDHAPNVTSSVLDQNIARRQHYPRAVIELN